MVKLHRTKYLVLGAVYMALSGMLYAWTNFSELIQADTGWSAGGVALVFTIWTIGSGLGNLCSGFLMRRFNGPKVICMGAVLNAAGIISSTFLHGSIIPFYILFSGLSGFGTGMLSVPIFTSVLSWYPDKTGLASGVMMMGLGVGTLVLGSLASVVAGDIGWRMFFRLFACAAVLLLAICAVVIKQPDPALLPASPEPASGGESVHRADIPTGKMLGSVFFWIFFFWATVGYSSNVIVSAHANQMAQQLHTSARLAGASVGIHHVFCAIGSIVLGGMYDRMGYKKTLLLENIILLSGVACFIGASVADSIPLFVAGLIIVGLGAGGIPSICSAHIRSFYGDKYYPTHYAIMNERMIVGSFGSYIAAAIYASTGGYLQVYVCLAGALALFFLLSSFIRRPKV